MKDNIWQGATLLPCKLLLKSNPRLQQSKIQKRVCFLELFSASPLIV